jgi:hypothetical protein
LENEVELLKQQLKPTFKTTLKKTSAEVQELAYQIVHGRTKSSSKNFLFIHGAWAGSWQFQRTAVLLESRGWKVHSPSLSGLGEHHHTANSDIGLNTHIEDIVQYIKFKQLYQVIICGFCYGGVVATGVADRLPDRISQLIYLDAYIPTSGDSMMNLRWKYNDVVENGYLIPTWVKTDSTPPNDVPHPYKTFTDHIELKNSIGAITKNIGSRNVSFILIVKEGKVTERLNEFIPYAEKIEKLGGQVFAMKGSHVSIWRQPVDTAEMLYQIGEDQSALLTKCNIFHLAIFINCEVYLYFYFNPLTFC